MPNCFSLTRKSDKAAGPVSLSKIDEELCQHFGVQPDPVKYYEGWYNSIGLQLALGRDFQYMREFIQGLFQKYPEEKVQLQHELDIINWFDQNSESDAWYQHK